MTLNKTTYVRDIYKPIKSFGQSVFWRFASLWLLVSLFYFLYNSHPYYLNPDFNNARGLMQKAYFIFCLLALPYTWFTLKFNYRFKDDFKDPTIIFFVLLKRIGLMVATRDPSQIAGLFKVKRFNNFCLTCLVKGFFLPLMTMFMFHHVTTVQSLVSRIATPMEGIQLAHWFLDLIYNSLFIVDTGVALVGYGLELKWLGNKTKSVEPTMFGWAVALMCYPPFNRISGDYFPLMDRQDLFIEFTEEQKIFIRIIIVLLYVVFVWATIALGVRFSNLSNKGIVDRGPYRFIRHPAYASKNIAWWFEHLQYMKGFHNVLFLCCWNLVYTIRAITEERHLMKDPEYKAYCKKVKYRFIPGLI
ncbi:MAG: isoprenylcysteine carboxylmethyltransferase family protein [Candidatus Melainabacteria bacterium]|nr:isoprenylcysteine carboxylmethyltransferase family protein [Candidatus Melainabacteria bacterium]